MQRDDFVPVIIDRESPSARALRQSLHHRWALLFSHPADFASYGFESDRWLCHVEATFQACGVQPVAIGVDERQPMPIWLTELGGCTADIHVQGVKHASRWVAIVDGSLRVHRTFTYQPHNPLLSLIDLAEVAAALRDRAASNRREGARLRLAVTTIAIVFATFVASTVARTRRRALISI